MPSYRKKPDAVDAIQWTGANTDAIRVLVGRALFDVTDRRFVGGRGLVMPGPDDSFAVATPRDWVVREPDGAVSVCSPDVFAARFEPALTVSIKVSEHIADMVANSLQYGRR